MRQDPDQQATSERDALGQYLDYQRETILLKTEGLTREQLGQIDGKPFTRRWVLLHLIEETARTRDRPICFARPLTAASANSGSGCYADTDEYDDRYNGHLFGNPPSLPPFTNQ
jgi:hypothetical protein